MDMQQLMMGIVKFLHDLFTVIWVGGLAVIVLTVLPSSKKTLGENLQVQKLMNAITRRHRIWVYVSIVGLFITGLLLGKSNPDFTGFMRFGNLYSGLTAVKHILTIAMVLIALFRSIRFGKKDSVQDPAKFKFSLILIVVNLILGTFVLLLSGLLAAL